MILWMYLNFTMTRLIPMIRYLAFSTWISRPTLRTISLQKWIGQAWLTHWKFVHLFLTTNSWNSLLRFHLRLNFREEMASTFSKKRLKEFFRRKFYIEKRWDSPCHWHGWFRNELKDLAYETIFNNTHDDFFQKSTIEQIWKQHQSGFRDRSTPLWTLFMFRLWQRNSS